LLLVISLAAGVAPSAGDNPAEANHSVAVGIDTDASGNTALALGTLQPCRAIAENEVIDVDVYVQNLSDIVAFDAYVGYDTTKIEITKPGASNQGQNARFMLQQAQPSPPNGPGNNFSNTSEALPDSANPGEYRIGGFDTNSIAGDPDPDPVEPNDHLSGVLVRLEIKGKASGFSPMFITPHGPSNGLGFNIGDTAGNDVGDGADADVFVDNVVNGGLVVGAGSCSDSDGDGFPDSFDNCPSISNGSQANFDGDANGDACDVDDDNDGVVDGSEPSSGCTFGGGQFDPDCDNDNVSDGLLDPDGAGPIVAGPDNCITTANTNQLNTDGDSMGNACDPDDDNDGILDGSDNCPVNANSSQSNMDGDTEGDACDAEDDGDGFTDAAEAWVVTNPLDNCGSHTASPPIYSQAWPADIFSTTGAVPTTTNKVTIQDLTSYVAPIRRINTDPGPPADPGYHVRWDILPGGGIFSKDINIQDITTLVTVAPLMFNNVRAFGHPTACVP
jgi:hypothetical protein